MVHVFVRAHTEVEIQRPLNRWLHVWKHLLSFVILEAAASKVPAAGRAAATEVVLTASSPLQGFDQLRIEGLLCDVTLVAGDGEEAFPVHRAMMASSSDYFKAMFTGESMRLFSEGRRIEFAFYCLQVK